MIIRSIASILIMLIFINSLGCAFTYHPIQLEDKNTIEKAKRIKLTTVDNREYILREVKVHDDRISGYIWMGDDYSKTRGEFSKVKIAQIEVEEIKTGSTVLIIVGVSVLIAGMFVMSGPNY